MMSTMADLKQKGEENRMHDYRNRFVTPEAAAQAVRSGDWVDYGFARASRS